MMYEKPDTNAPKMNWVGRLCFPVGRLLVDRLKSRSVAGKPSPWVKAEKRTLREEMVRTESPLHTWEEKIPCPYSRGLWITATIPIPSCSWKAAWAAALAALDRDFWCPQSSVGFQSPQYVSWSRIPASLVRSWNWLTTLLYTPESSQVEYCFIQTATFSAHASEALDRDTIHPTFPHPVIHGHAANKGETRLPLWWRTGSLTQLRT